MNLIPSIVRQWFAPRTPAPKPSPTGFERDGVTFPGALVYWRSVGAVLVYKVDCYSYDQIRAAFLDDQGAVLFEVPEDTEIYQPLMEQLPAHLPGCLKFEEWFFEVAFPAFETKPVLIFRRNAAQ